MNLSTSCVILAALCWGLSGGIGGLLMTHGWEPLVVAFYRGAIGLAIVVVWLFLQHRHSGLGNRQLWFWSSIAGLGFAGNFSFYFISIAEGSIAVAATLMYCAPVFVYLVSFALGMEKSTVKKWAAIALVMLGIVLLTQAYKLGASTITPLAVIAGLMAGLSYTLFIFGFKYAAQHGSPQAILSIAFTAFVIVLLGPADVNQASAVLTSPDWLLFITLGVFGAGLSFVLYIMGLKYTAPAVASIVAMVEPVTASLFGVLVLSQNLVAIQIVGMAVILITVTVLSIFSRFE